MKNSARYSMLAVLCVVTLTVLLLFAAQNNVSAFTPGDRITAALSRLGVQDAKFAEQVCEPELRKDGCLLYTSDSTQMGYYFEPDTGVLTAIVHYSFMDGTYGEKASASHTVAPMQVSIADPGAELIEYAKSCIGEAQIGTLQLQETLDHGLFYRYIITEVYDGFETGTTVIFSCDTSGRINSCNITIGSIFERSPSGTYVLAAGEDLIGEAAAIEVARKGLEALMEPSQISDRITCELSAAEDALIYTVTIDYTDETNLPRNYMATINAHTGQLRHACTS